MLDKLKKGFLSLLNYNARRTSFSIILIGVAFLFTTQTNIVFAQTDKVNIDERIEELLEKIETKLGVLPGIGISVVEGEDILLSKGYGVDSINTNNPFDNHTYSYIASSTKAFVGLTMAILAENGDLDLDIPIGPTYLADFDQEKLGAFAGVTFRQLLTHTHGLRDYNIVYRTAYTGDMTTEVFWEQVGRLEPLESGTDYVYSNLGYVATSYVLEHMFKESWQSIVERLVIAPAGLNETEFQISSLVGKPVAMPHVWMGETKLIPLYKRDNTMHAAGGQYSTAHDLARWLLLNLNHGEIDGQQLISPTAIELTQSPLVQLDKSFYEYNRTDYGFGWYTADYDGQVLMHHFGSFSGYRSHVSIMPEINLGVAIITNDASRPTFFIPEMVASYIYDIALGKENVEEKYDQKIEELVELIAQYESGDIPVRPRNAPDNELSFSGIYENVLWGKWELRNHNGEVKLDWGNISSDIIYVEREGETYMRFELAGRGFLAKLSRDEQGRLNGLIFKGEMLLRQ